MRNQSWPTAALLGVIALLLGLLIVLQRSPAAEAQASEGRSGSIIAVATPIGDESLLYLVDTSREVVLVYAFHHPGSLGRSRDIRTGSFEFLAGRLYRWDAMLASKRQYALKGVRQLQGLRPNGGAGSSEFEYKQTEQ